MYKKYSKYWKGAGKLKVGEKHPRNSQQGKYIDFKREPGICNFHGRSVPHTLRKTPSAITKSPVFPLSSIPRIPRESKGPESTLKLGQGDEYRGLFSGGFQGWARGGSTGGSRGGFKSSFRAFRRAPGVAPGVVSGGLACLHGAVDMRLLSLPCQLYRLSSLLLFSFIIPA